MDLLEDFRRLGEYKYIQIRSELNEPNLIFMDSVEVLPLAKVTHENPTRAQSFLVVEETRRFFYERLLYVTEAGSEK